MLSIVYLQLALLLRFSNGVWKCLKSAGLKSLSKWLEMCEIGSCQEYWILDGNSELLVQFLSYMVFNLECFGPL